MLLADTDTPGITVRRIKMIDGHDHTNEVFFDNVRVPAANLVGERGRGWNYAKFLLGNERSGLLRIGLIKAQLAHLKRVTRLEQAKGRSLAEDPVFRAKVASVIAEVTAFELSVLRLVVVGPPGLTPGTEANMLKIKSAALLQRISTLLMEALGPSALPNLSHRVNGDDLSVGSHADVITQNYIDMRKASIYGGSSEVQRNIVAKATLGL
jgi:alkylation response protein AidB-like acyl-CoA dehydrogenase